MEIKLKSTLDKLKEEGKVTNIPSNEINEAMERLQEKMDDFEVEFRAMQAESEQIAAEVYLTF
jgi:hypothetical protein